MQDWQNVNKATIDGFNKMSDDAKAAIIAAGLMDMCAKGSQAKKPGVQEELDAFCAEVCAAVEKVAAK